MGSCLSSILFVHLMEESVITRLKKTGGILSWVRFADDVICIAKKGSVEKIHEKINKWDSNLKFTCEKMFENSLICLDCELYISENGSIEFRNYKNMVRIP